MKVYQLLGQALAADQGETIQKMMDFLPSGSGFDAGIMAHYEKEDDQLVLFVDYHVMDDVGHYVGWIQTKIVCRVDLARGMVTEYQHDQIEPCPDHCGYCGECEHCYNEEYDIIACEDCAMAARWECGLADYIIETIHGALEEEVVFNPTTRQYSTVVPVTRTPRITNIGSIHNSRVRDSDPQGNCSGCGIPLYPRAYQLEMEIGRDKYKITLTSCDNCGAVTC